MKIRTMPALLLSLLVVAGVAATDAYAQQSNTERIQDIQRDTGVISDAVEAIQSAITALSESLSEKMDELLSSMTDVRSSVDSVNENIASLETNTTSSISSIQTTLDEISMSVQAIAESDDDGSSSSSMEASATTVALNDIVDGMSRINARISSMSDQLTSVDNRLANIEIRISALELESTSTPTTPAPIISDTLVERTIQKDVTAYDYKKQGSKKSDRNSFNYYDLDLTFSCNNKVFIDNVRMIQRIGAEEEYLDRSADYTSDPEAPPDGTNESINYVKVDGRYLYHNWFVVSGTDHIEYNPTSQDFGPEGIQALSFETRVYDGNFTAAGLYNVPVTGAGTFLIADAPKPERVDRVLTDSSVELYTLQVTYETIRPNTSCSLNFGKAGSSGLNVDTPTTLTFGAAVEEGSAILKDFENTIDCGGNPVEVTGLTTGITDDWNDSISSFAKLYLTVEDGVDDDSPDATFTFDSEGRATLSEGNYPSFGNADLKVHGKLPGDGLLISIEYLSVSANVCSNTEATS